jgi:hypothetical protein
LHDSGGGSFTEYALVEVEDAMGSLRCERIVCHHQYGLLVFGREFFEQIKNFVSTLTVEISRGLVTQQEGRIGDNRASNTYALFLSTGELARIMMHTIA